MYKSRNRLVISQLVRTKFCLTVLYSTKIRMKNLGSQPTQNGIKYFSCLCVCACERWKIVAQSQRFSLSHNMLNVHMIFEVSMNYVKNLIISTNWKMHITELQLVRLYIISMP